MKTDKRSTTAPPEALAIKWDTLLSDLNKFERLTTLRSLSEYHEDHGAVLWWHLPIQEPPYVGAGPGMDERHGDGTRTMCARLLGEGWLTHWSLIPQPSLPPDASVRGHK